MYRDRQSHTWLDLFILRDESLLDSYHKSPAPIIAGHDLIELKFKYFKAPKKPSNLLTRNFKHLDIDKLSHSLTTGLYNLRSEISNLKCSLDDQVSLIDGTITDLSALVDQTSKTLLNSFDLVAPLITINNVNKQKPWVSKDIRAHMKERDQSYRIAKQSNLYVDFLKFRFLRNRVSNSLSTAKNAYFANRLKAAPDLNSKWHELRKLGIASKKKDSPFKYFSSSVLNTHYANVARKLEPLSPADVQQILLNSPLNQEREIFSFAEISEEDVLNSISSSTSKTFGIDLISSKMLKLAAPTLSKHLQDIFNFSLKTGTFPASWKQTLISPLLKKCPPVSPSDTRPIARLSEISKVLERIVHKQLSKFIEDNKLIDPCQSGFRPGRSTQTALLEVLEFTRLGIENRQLTILVLFDFEKAFDSISHKILLESLRLLNCSDMTIKWFASYLSKRAQAVASDDGLYSEWLDIFTGVPQGSVLGPLLFLIFINDLRNVLTLCKHTLFADDLQIYLNCYRHDLDNGLRKINDEVIAVSNWAKAKGIRLNLSKTKVMILGSKGFISHIDLASLRPIVVDNAIIPFVTEAKNLGLILTPSLSWSCQVTSVVSKVNRILFTLRQAKHALSFSLRKYLIESLIFPHFGYACACMTDIDATLNLKLQRLQNACTRFVYSSIKPFDHVTPFRIALGWLSVTRRRDYFTANQAYAILSNCSNHQLALRFTRVNEQAQVRRTNRLLQYCLLQPFARTVTFEHSFTATATHLLNFFNVQIFDSKIIADVKSVWFSKLIELDKSEWDLRVATEGLTVPRVPSFLFNAPS